MDTPETTQAQFDHEKLDVYQLELSFLEWVTPLLQQIRSDSPGLHREVCDQLDRASLSFLLNTAEGNGKRPGPQRARFFDDARGSAVECAACLDALAAKGLVAKGGVEQGKAMLLRVVSMLTKLVVRFDRSGGKLKEDEVLYDAGPPPEAIEDGGRERGGGG